MPLRQLAEQPRLRRRLAAMRVESRQRDAHHGDAAGLAMTWHAVLDRVAEAARRKLGLERVARVEVRGRLHDVGLDLEDVLERLVARLAGAAREPRPTQELIGVGERDGARAAAGERARDRSSR